MAKFTITIEVDSDGTIRQVIPSGTTSPTYNATKSSGRSLASSRLSSSFPRSQAKGLGLGGDPPGLGPGGDPPFLDPGGKPIGPRPGNPLGPGGDPPGLDPGGDPPGLDPGGDAIGSRYDVVSVEPQQQSEWCWAAVTLAVEKYFNPASTLTQCSIANRVLGQKSCCGDQKEQAACNKLEELQNALASVNRLAAAIARPLRFTEVKQQIDAGLPVCARIQWASGGAHFVVLEGYRVLPSGAQHVYVADPLNPSAEVDFEEFMLAYHGEGEWTGSYLVQAW